MAAKYFLVIAIAAGVLLGFASPPFRWGDENIHFRQACLLSEGMLSQAGLGSRAAGSLPSGVQGLISYFSLLQIASPDRVVTWPQVVASADIVLAPEKRIVWPVERMSLSPLSHAPQAVGITLARVASDSALLAFVAARLGVFVTWLGLTWLALRIAPELRWPMLVIALAPMTLFLAVSCGADALLIGLAFLWTATVLRLAVEEEARIGALPLLGLYVLGVSLALVKLVYGPLLLLALIIPSERFGGRGRRVRALALVLGSGGVAVLAWLYLGQATAQRSLSLHDPATLRAHVSQLGSDPIELARTIVRTTANQLEHWLRQLADTHWGAPLAKKSALWLWLGALAAAIVADPPRRIALPLAQRVLLLGIVAVVFLTIVLAALALWSPPGSREAQGVQGRYWIPLLPTLLLALAPSHLSPARLTQRISRGLALALTLIVLAETCRRGFGLYLMRG